MANLSELELQNIRHLMGGYDTSHCKLKEYATAATDPKVKQFFEKGAQSAMDNKNTLMKFLQQQTGKKGMVIDMQLNEKTMVADTLAGINGELVRFGEMIPQTENKELKQTLKQFRNACEQSQEEIYQIARDKSYYVPASKATQEEIDHVKSLFTEKVL